MINHQGKSDLLIPSLVSGEFSYQPRTGNWELDIINRTDSWSDHIFDILELPYDTKMDHALFFGFYNEPYRGMLRKAIEVAKLIGTPWELELELVTAKNRMIWVCSYGHAVMVDDKVLKLKGTFVDIDQYRSNTSSFNLLKQRHKQLSGFTHILTHNLRNHANNITTLTFMVDKDELSPDNADLFNKIAKVSANLSTTIEHLSEVMKVNENEMECENLVFASVLEAVGTLLAPELEKNSVRIETDFTVPSILFSKIYLESILMNLISNSVKYRKDMESPEIFISTYPDIEKNGVVLEYQDNGIGIDLDKYGDKIFGLYKTFTDRPGAHGVGLFLVKTQVESQGGYIIVESKPGIGTIFRIYFKPEK
jgi:signal transduction histidine kinase